MQKNYKIEMMKLINDLWFLKRDIVSDGFDDALNYISKIIPLKIHKIPSGTKCWTWTVPEKWIAKGAHIEDLKGNKLLDLKDHPLHLMSYSLPINKIVSREELLLHLHTRLDRPNAIPFEFKYYQKDWGFCIQNNRLKDFQDKEYKVFIDSKFEKGNLKVGEYTIKGKTKETIVLVAHLCHPCQANDDLAGVAVLVDIAKELSKKNNYYTYKILFVPETIGSIAYLSQNEKIIKDIKYGIFLEMLGNDNNLALQFSRQLNTKLDKIAEYVIKKSTKNFRQGKFREIVRNDEMVFNGPGVNVPMISISRFSYLEYHTSDDNLEIIKEEKLKEAKQITLEILDIIDKDYIPKRTFKGPIFLSGLDLWVDWRKNRKLNESLEKIMLNLEGDKSVFEISEELNMDFYEVLSYINKFLEKKLINKNK